jgi:hypothetical protein
MALIVMGSVPTWMILTMVATTIELRPFVTDRRRLIGLRTDFAQVVSIDAGPF